MPDDVTVTGELTVSGTGQSSFGGQVTIPQTPTADTDAASKKYVDDLVSGGLTFRGTFNAATGEILSGVSSGSKLYNCPGGAGTRIAVAVGDYYIVATAGGSFYCSGATLDIGDSIIATAAANANASVVTGWSVVQSDEGVASFTNANGTFVSAGTVNSNATGAVTMGTIDLSATGTKNNTTFLRGDNTWAVPAYVSYSAMTTSTLGLGKIKYDFGSTPAAESQSTTAARTYGVTKNASDQLVVNVPWVNSSDVNSVTASGATTALSGLTSTPNTGAVVIGLDINGRASLGSPAGDDELMIYDTSTAKNVKVLVSDLASYAGSAATNQVTYWTSANEIGGAAGFTFAGGANGAVTMGGALQVGGNVEVRSGNKLILQRPNNGVATEISTDSTGAMILNSINDEGFFFNNAGTNAFKLDPINATFAGNVGIGITPSASFSGVEVLQLGKGMTIFGNTNDDRATMASNLILNTGTAFEYVMDGLAGKFSIEDGNMSFGTAPSGTAGNVATITERFAIANTGGATFSGDVGIGGTGIYTSSHSLNIDGTGLAIKNNVNGSSNNWSVIKNTASSSGSNLEFYTATGKVKIDSLGNTTFGNFTYGSALGQVRIITDGASTPATLSLFGYNNIADGGNYASIDFAMQSSGTGGQVVSSIRGLAEGTGENASDLAFYTATGGTLAEKMRITSGGLVGIGTATPQDFDAESRNLVIRAGVNGSNPTVGITIAGDGDQAATGRGAIRFADGAVGNARYRGALEYEHDGDYMFFRTAAVERMRISSDGKVTIGNTASVQPLTVAGNVLFRTSTADGFENRFQFIPGGSGDAGNFYVYNASETATIRLNSGGDSYFNGGNVGIGTATPTSPTSVATFLAIEGTTAGIVLSDNGDAAYKWDIWNSGGGLFMKYNDTTFGVCQLSNGKVGIGTTLPSEKLQVKGNICVNSESVSTATAEIDKIEFKKISSKWCFWLLYFRRNKVKNFWWLFRRIKFLYW